MFKGFAHLWLIILLLLSTLGFTSYRLQDPDFLVEQGRKVNLYNRIINQYDLFIPDQVTKTAPYTADELKQILTYAIDGQTFYDFMDAYLTSYLDYYTGRADKLYFGYNLDPVKARAKTKANEILSAKYYNELPECKSSQLRDWSMAETLPTCRLPKSNVAQTDIDRQLSALVEKMAADVPGSIIVSSASPAVARARTFIMIDVKANYIIWAATGLLTLLYLLFRRRKAFVPLGLIMLVVGAAEVGLSFFAWDWLAKNIIDYATTNQDYAKFSSIIADATDVTAQVLKTTLGTISIVIIGTGIALIILGIFFRPKKMILPV